MNRLGKIGAGFCAVAALAWASSALADLPPLDSCNTAGASCTNAGGLGNEPGTCTATTCQKRTPGGDIITYDCLRCLAATGGAGSGGAANSGGRSQSGGATSDAGGGGAEQNGGTTSDAGGGGAEQNGGTTSQSGGARHSGGATNRGGSAGSSNVPEKHEDTSGCSVSRAPGEHAASSLWLLVGLAALLGSRRKRQP